MSELKSPRTRLHALQQQVIACTRCPRLIRYCREVAQQKKRMFRDQEYWGRPVPGFGDPDAQLLIVGLAPAAHGGNRTGRVFTGDRSGDFLFRALFEAGFANQATSVGRDDGLQLHGCYIAAALRCAPPNNKPRPEELLNCRPYLVEELRLLRRLRAVLALGRIAFDAYLQVTYEGRPHRGPRSGDRQVSKPVPGGERLGTEPALPPRSSWQFAHGANIALPGLPRLFVSYHPSQQNTQTGKLTARMFRKVLEEIRDYLATPEGERN
ncbi:MAG TPA: uracil-DNA glycosylase [Terriglobia bacterium]|nr:uracil-DNA glycosylase [Terriglobia bacterium]